jgi:Nucleotide modification associated domain 2
MRVWRYVITNDSGFAPNFEPPATTLATCKPRIRQHAEAGDLIVAFNGEPLNRNEPHSVRWAGIVSDVMQLAEYWGDLRFQGKKPAQHGGHRSGGSPDNIYRPTRDGALEQVENNSHGPDSAARDTGGRNALVLQRSWYFGPTVAVLPEHFNLRIVGGRRGQPQSEIDEQTWRELEGWLDRNSPDPGALSQSVDQEAHCALRTKATSKASSAELPARRRC